MPRSTVVLGLLTLATVAAVAGMSAAQQGPGGARTNIRPGEECPPGMTETRPGTCQAPSTPAPSIVDYRPRSTLVTDVHPVPKAKFPAIDVHGHPPSLTSPEAIAGVVAAMDALNLRVLVSADNSSGERLTRALQAIDASPHKDRFRVLAGIDFRNVGPGWGEKAVRQLEADMQGRSHRRRRDCQELRPHHAQARRQPAQGGRPGAGSDLGSLSPAGSPGVHPHG